MPKYATVYTITPSPDSTLAVEIQRSGIAKRKHLFVFERYSGELVYDPAEPLESRLNLSIETASLACRDSWQSPKKRAALAQFVRNEILNVGENPLASVRSERFVAKPLRGFVAEALVDFQSKKRALKANVGFGTLKKARIHVDADCTIRLSEFELARPSSFFGLFRTEDGAVLHASVWGAVANEAGLSNQI